MENSVVLLSIVSNRDYNYNNVREITPSEQGTCSGVCVKVNNKKYILTCNHCYGDIIHVSSPLSSKTYNASIVLLSYDDEDLMLLSSDICDILTPVSVYDTLVNIGDKVTVYSMQTEASGGFSVNKNSIRSYTYSAILGVNNLIYVLNRTVVFGDSGGPIVNQNNQLVGITSYGNALVSYIVSNIVITKFLNEKLNYFIKNGEHYPTIFNTLLVISLDNIDTGYFNFNNKGYGVLIRDIYDHSSPFKRNDILLKINNINILNNGQFNLKEIYPHIKTNGAVPYLVYLNMISPMVEYSHTVWRNGKELTFKYDYPTSISTLYTYAIDVPKPFKWCGIVFTGIDKTLQSNLILKDVAYYDYYSRVMGEIRGGIKFVLMLRFIYSQHVKFIPPANAFIKSVNNIIIQDIIHLKKTIHELENDNSVKYIIFEYYADNNITIINKKNISLLTKEYFENYP